MKSAIICAQDDFGNLLVVTVPPSREYDTGALRDELEDLGYETRGTVELITLAEAKKRAKDNA